MISYDFILFFKYYLLFVKISNLNYNVSRHNKFHKYITKTEFLCMNRNYIGVNFLYIF